MMRFIFITNSAELAAFAVSSGVDRLMVDLEIIGKVERQGHLSTVISRHSFEDVGVVRAAAPNAELVVRLNPVHDGSAGEIDRAIALGADMLMLPMFKSAAEVQNFSALVAGRRRICLLLETAAAVRELQQIVATPGIDEIHVGLNDLHLDLQQTFMFEPLAEGLVDEIAAIVTSAGLALGIGGLARVGEGLLPAELLIAEHVRLGSTAAILSRTFHRNSATVREIENEMDFAGEILKLREAYTSSSAAPAGDLVATHKQVQECVADIVAKIARSRLQQQ
ncbi:aldolase/citrate lyase family protein [Devosia sp. A369]